MGSMRLNGRPEMFRAALIDDAMPMATLPESAPPPMVVDVKVGRRKRGEGDCGVDERKWHWERVESEDACFLELLFPSECEMVDNES